MTLRTTVLTLTGALALLLGPAAHAAEAVSVDDANHDATGHTRKSRSIDIQSFEYARDGKRIEITYHLLRFNSYTKDTNFISTAKIGGKVRYGLDSAGGDTAYIVDLDKAKSVPCARASADRHKADRTVTLSFPSRCIGSPRRIALMGTTALLNGYGPFSEDDTRYGKAISLR